MEDILKGRLKFFNIFLLRLLVECFTKYCVIGEAIRHFRALKNFPGGTKVLYNEGNFGDPLSLYLRALCRDGMFFSFFHFVDRQLLVFLICSHINHIFAFINSYIVW